MKRKKAISVIAIILAVLMLVSLVAGMIPTFAYADELDELRAKKDELTRQVKEIGERIEGLEEQQANVLEQKVALEERNRLAAEQLEIIAAEIANYDELIEIKAKEVDAAKNREAVQLSKYRTRIRAMEENGGYNILAVLFEAENFAQLLTALDDMGEIMDSDKKLQRQYEDAREETEEIKAAYEAEKAVYEGEQAELYAEQQEILDQVAEAEERLEALEEEIEQAKQEYAAAEAAEQAAAATIANVIAANNARKAQERAEAQAAAAAAAAEAQQLVDQMTQANAEAAAAGENAPFTELEIQTVAEAANIGYVAGNSSEGFIWPLPCSTRITSRFGNRTDPFTGQTRYHSGIDIDGFGNDGAPVVAAASGTVITASYDGAYGNYVIIDHGDTSTVYAHMQALAVSYGDYVSQGQTIGYVGATGRATGTHLHFEVYVGDGRVDPAQYFSGMTYYNC
ncbi:MAG: peptidoglycan DD-metalloendopeptidase family protein [Oscillospiraceae bacterium]|nr:peptidoglycan DD-metalloendopeptidase family protein [Oscillospiraceae bacterium]